MRNVKGIVLCGGEGTRLRPLTYYFQKSMLPVGKKQRPILEYIIRLLKFHEIRDIILLVGYKAEQIINYFDDGSKLGVNITYVYDDPNLRGTAGSIVNAYRKGAINVNDTILVYYGDTLTDVNISDMISFHRAKNGTSTLALSRGFVAGAVIVDMEEDLRIRQIKIRPIIDKLTALPLLVLDGRALPYMDKLSINRPRLELMSEFIPHLLNIGEKVYGFVTDAFWLDIGSTEVYEKLNHELIDDRLGYLFE